MYFAKKIFIRNQISLFNFFYLALSMIFVFSFNFLSILDKICYIFSFNLCFITLADSFETNLGKIEKDPQASRQLAPVVVVIPFTTLNINSSKEYIRFWLNLIKNTSKTDIFFLTVLLKLILIQLKSHIKYKLNE